MIKLWKKEAFAHLHFGGIIFTNTYHAQKDLPTTCRMTLLDIMFANYEYACIGTIQLH